MDKHCSEKSEFKKFLEPDEYWRKQVYNDDDEDMELLTPVIPTHEWLDDIDDGLAHEVYASEISDANFDEENTEFPNKACYDRDTIAIESGKNFITAEKDIVEDMNRTNIKNYLQEKKPLKPKPKHIFQRLMFCLSLIHI